MAVREYRVQQGQCYSGRAVNYQVVLAEDGSAQAHLNLSITSGQEIVRIVALKELSLRLGI